MSRRAARESTLPDRDAFEHFVGPHLAVLRAVASREVGSGEADDVVQDALVRAWQRRVTFDPEQGSARAWLIAIVLDRSRRLRVRGRRSAAGGDIDAHALVDSPDVRLDVEAAVRELPRRQRQIVTLHYLADLPVSEVAIVLGITSGAVKAQLSDARTHLRRIMESG